jgi:transcriptional/translational regulatory protein YebC/TACO1
VFTKFGGNLAGAGAVAFQFVHAGQFLIARDATTEDALMELCLGIGADDVLTTEDGYEVRCDVHAFDRVSHALEEKGLKPESAEIAYIPTSTVPVADLELARTLVKLHDGLDELDDVQQVFSNEELDEAIAAAAQE